MFFSQALCYVLDVVHHAAGAVASRRSQLDEAKERVHRFGGRRRTAAAVRRHVRVSALGGDDQQRRAKNDRRDRGRTDATLRHESDGPTA